MKALRIWEMKLFILTFLIFTFGIIIGGNFFWSQKSQEVIYEEYDSFTDISYIEMPVWYDVEWETKEKYRAFLDEQKQKEKDLFSQGNIQISYFPSYLEDQESLQRKRSFIETILSSEVFEKYHISLKIELHEKKHHVRGTFQNDTIRLFGVKYLSDEEFLAVFIHELGHYFDVQYFQKKVLFDLSNNFYKLSFEDTKVLRSDAVSTDFVSGYAMSNKYEDFAESFIYYVLYNEEFLRKAQFSDVLRQKYDFFHKYLFTNNQFVGIDFSSQKEEKYYWDITKKGYFLEKVLNYFKK